MEEVWKDISLSSLNDTATSSSSGNPTFPSPIFQDFLARPRPSNNEPPTRLFNEETTFFGSPATILSLKSGSDHPVSPKPNLAVATNNTAVHRFGSSAVVFPSFCRKRAQENDENPKDRRNKLMMKNRESAARSRARTLAPLLLSPGTVLSQAYRSELEREVVLLHEENAKLRKQQDKLMAAPNQFPKKNSLSRSLTAPF